jgi:hypothetical protein
MDDHLFCLPLPQHIEDIDGAARSQSSRSCADALFAEAPTRDPLILIERLALPARAIVARWHTAAQSGAAASGGSERNTEYDVYFGVQRHLGGDPLVCLCEAALVAYYRLMLDSLRGHSLGPVELAHLQGTFEAIISSLAGTPVPAPADPMATGASTGTRMAAPVDAMVRWKLGHHAFFVLIQMLIVAHARLAAALNQGHLGVAHEAFSLSTRLWWGTAATFRYTADFDADDYENIVRPSMSPPFLKEGFSGLFSPDHSHLLRIVKSIRPSLQALPEALCRDHQLYLEGLDVMYEAHAFVCEQFVGGGRSLKGGSYKDPSTSAPNIIRRDLKSRTMLLAGGRSSK